jgi:hypothetical protein
VRNPIYSRGRCHHPGSGLLMGDSRLIVYGALLWLSFPRLRRGCTKNPRSSRRLGASTRRSAPPSRAGYRAADSLEAGMSAMRQTRKDCPAYPDGPYYLLNDARPPARCPTCAGPMAGPAPRSRDSPLPAVASSSKPNRSATEPTGEQRVRRSEDLQTIAQNRRGRLRPASARHHSRQPWHLRTTRGSAPIVLKRCFG